MYESHNLVPLIITVSLFWIIMIENIQSSSTTHVDNIIQDLSMQVILVYMVLHLQTLEKIIKLLILTENKKNLFMLQEFPKNRQELFIFTTKKSMDSVMEIQLPLERLKVWKKLTENNTKLLLDLLTALLLEILLNSILMSQVVLLQKLKCLLSKSSTHQKGVYHILILLIQNKCQFAAGKNSVSLNNSM